MAASHKDHQVLHQVPQREPTSSKVFPEGASKVRIVVLTQYDRSCCQETQCECGAYICTVNVTFKSTNASPFNLFCGDSVQEIGL